MLSAESAVLASIIAEPNLIAIASGGGLKASSFCDPRNALIFSAMLGLHRAEIAVDYITLHKHMLSEGTLTDAGGIGYVVSIGDELPFVAHFDQYLAAVREDGIREQIKAAAGEMVGTLSIMSGPESLANAQRIIQEISSSVYASGFAKISDTVDDIVLRLEDGEISVMGTSTGYPTLDGITLGLTPGNLVIVAGRPGMGKSALATNIAHNVSKLGIPVGMVSLEMSAEELGFRVLSSETELSQEFIKQGKFGKVGWENIANARKRIAQYPLFVEDHGSMNVLELQSNARKMHAERGLGLLVVDYLQLMTSGLDSQSREREVADITRGLKQLAKSLKIPIMALSQLNRSVENRQSQRPNLSDLRESGAIEQDSDIVMFIYRDAYYTKTHGKDAEIIIAKNRNGRTGTVKLDYIADITTFKEKSDVLHD